MNSEIFSDDLVQKDDHVLPEYDSDCEGTRIEWCKKHNSLRICQLGNARNFLKSRYTLFCQLAHDASCIIIIIIIITGRQTQSLEAIGHTRSVSAATSAGPTLVCMLQIEEIGHVIRLPNCSSCEALHVPCY